MKKKVKWRWWMDIVSGGVLQGELFLRCGLTVTTLGFCMFRLREASSLSGMTTGKGVKKGERTGDG